MIQLKHLEFPLQVNKEVAVVGSSSILLLEEFGPVIDSFQNIIRFNRSPIKGWEKYVGGKEDIRVANCGVIDNRDWKGRWESTQPGDFIRKCRDCHIIQCGPKIPNMKNYEDNIHDSCSFNIIKHEEIYKDAPVPHPSVGLTTILLLIKSGAIPSVFGFNIWDDPPKLTHYFEKRDNLSYSHNMEIENDCLKRLAAKRLINIYYTI